MKFGRTKYGRTHRTTAQIQAQERDGPWCLWHRYKLGGLVPGCHVHHIAHRHPGTDVPELCIAICAQCHYRAHNGQEPSREQLADLLYELYGFTLQTDFPELFK